MMVVSGQKIRIILFLLFIVVIVLMRFSPAGSVLTFENLKQHRENLLVFVQHNYTTAAAAFILVYILTTSLSIPGAVILTLAGGFLFGAIAGTMYVVVGATTGASLAFLSARYLVGNRLQEKYQNQFKKFNDEIERNGTSYLLTLRLIAVFPFFLINFLAGLTKISVRTFLWTTAVGIIPGTAVFAFAGQQIGSINSLTEILSRKVLAAFAVLALFTLVPVIWKRLKNGAGTAA
jgi:uncharacterized membrane protein YdjX (TVP38/TMEM64 family)